MGIVGETSPVPLIIPVLHNFLLHLTSPQPRVNILSACFFEFFGFLFTDLQSHFLEGARRSTKQEHQSFPTSHKETGPSCSNGPPPTVRQLSRRKGGHQHQLCNRGRTKPCDARLAPGHWRCDVSLPPFLSPLNRRKETHL